ncbi:MAG: DNA-binding protein WhiA [Clostridia bacterium]|nr:DNA-binding protein WhiA [Clostridia bacterium]
MSFSQDIKDEILNIKSKKHCCLTVQKQAELLSESEEPADVTLKDNIINNNCCKKAFLKGLFLGTGCIVDPNTDYHFEITTKTKRNGQYVVEILNNIMGFSSKLLKRSNNLYVIYIKDSNQISDILSYLETSRALLKFESIRVERSVKNNINRTINCETANLSKTISAAYRQILAIEKIEKLGLFDKLPIELQEVSIIRKKHPDLSLEELKEHLSVEISKSGLNHRLNKIIKIAEKGSI